MSTDSTAALRKRVSTYERRTDLLKFQLSSNRLNSRVKIVMNGSRDFHLNDCVWSVDGVKAGPDTCHCTFAVPSPLKYFDEKIGKDPETSLVSHLHPEDKEEVPRVDEWTSFKDLLSDFDTDEDLDEFYRRIRDRPNVARWLETYASKLNVLRFRLRMIELKKDRELDVVLNEESGEWHLTDCKRSVHRSEGPDTCACSKAMSDPKRYLEVKYDYVDPKEARSPKIPVRYERIV